MLMLNPKHILYLMIEFEIKIMKTNKMKRLS